MASRKKNAKIIQLRSIAFYIDLVVIIIVTNVLLNIVQGSNSFYLNSINSYPKFIIDVEVSHLFEALIMFLIIPTYFTLTYYLGDGRSLGKFLLNLKVHNPSRLNSSMSFNESFKRAISYQFFFTTFFLPFVINLIRKDGKGIQDFLSETIVYQENEYQEALAQYKDNAINAYQVQLDLFENNVIALPVADVVQLSTDQASTEKNKKAA